MAPDPTPDFDEEAWQKGASDGPSFQFGEQTGQPAFEPEDEDSAGSEHQRAWRSAEPAWEQAPGEDFGDQEPYAGEARRPGMPNAEERQWAMIGHAAGAVSLLASSGFAGWLVPLIIWLIKRDDGGFASEQAREALNFQVTAFLVGLIALPLTCIGVGIVILIAIPICAFIFSIIGAVRTWNGERYDYPINFRLI